MQTFAFKLLHLISFSTAQQAQWLLLTYQATHSAYQQSFHLDAIRVWTYRFRFSLFTTEHLIILFHHLCS